MYAMYNLFIWFPRF
uniref:Uncharacterized protein n=1 Tax=Rhizophora mucronata TaxID=61149 RepID=A0A2P2NAG2_RHIMU